MVRLLDYTLTEMIYESDKTVVHRGIRESDARPVMLKRLNQAYPSPERLERFRQEYELTKQLGLRGAVAAYDLESYENSLVMVLEDFGGMSLHHLLDGKPMDVAAFLPVALRLAEILGELHQQRLIHKDLNPSNIVWNPDKDEIKLIDFGIAEALTEDREAPSGGFEGTLAYMPPEQTGRMSHRLDERSDLYALGVTFYELLVGERPFRTTDAMELIHCHFARLPEPPNKCLASIPGQVSALVLKLMAKSPTERYQSTFGLRSDLLRCQEELTATGEISLFPLGQNDLATQLDLSRELIGREDESLALLEEYDKAKAGALRLVLVGGDAGVGKSRLLQAFQRQATLEDAGYCVGGKFDQFQHEQPYAALVQALSQLLRRVLGEDEASQKRWRDALRKRLGDSGGVLLKLLPGLAAVTGPFAAPPELPPQQAQYRFQRSLLLLLSALAELSGPLVLFVDDLQWADAPTIRLLEALATDAPTLPLLLLGTYRPDEVSEFMVPALERLRAREQCHHMLLEPLTKAQIEASFVTSLRRKDVAEFAALCHRKTQGNPFFLHEMLQTLCRDNILVFAPTTGQWEWSLDEVEATPVSANVVDWMAQRLAATSRAVQLVLPQAACLGNRFSLGVLLQVCTAPNETILAALQEAHNEGLILPSRSTAWGAEEGEQTYLFAHDRIQQAAYGLLSVEERQALHLQIGEALHAQCEGVIPPERLFAIAHQMNLGAMLLTTPEAQVSLAQINLDAGRHAKRTAAHESAAAFFEQGLALIEGMGWDQEYQRLLALHQERAEVAYFRANFAVLAQHAGAIKAHATTLLDKIEIHSLEIQALISRHQPKKGLELALDVLAQMGIKMPRNPGVRHIILGLIGTQRMLSKTTPEALANHREMTDPHKLAAMHLLSRSSLDFAAFLTMPRLFPLIVVEQVKLSFLHGHTPDSAVAYVSYAMLLCGALKDYPMGRRYGELALQQLDRFEARALQSKVNKLYYGFVAPWTSPVKDTLKPLMGAYQAGQETGFLDSMVGAGFVHAYHSFFFVGQLTPLKEGFAHRKDVAFKSKQEVHVDYYSCYQQLLSQLQADVPNAVLSGEFYDPTETLPRQREANDNTGIFLYHFLGTFLACLFQEYELAIEHAHAADPYTESAMGSVGPPLTDFFHALACLGRWPEVSGMARWKMQRRVNKIRKSLKLWATHAPANYGAKEALLSAEWHRVNRRDRQAIACYEEASDLGRQHESLLDEALANELAGRFALQRGQMKAGQVYLRDAHFLYRQWGADAKVNALENRYPVLQISPVLVRPGLTTGTQTKTTVSTEGDSQNLDLNTLLKATQAISETIVLGHLLAKLMRFAIENAGAERGVLLLQKQGDWLIEAAGHAEQTESEIQVLQSEAIEEAQTPEGKALLCEALVRIVAHDALPIVVDNASADPDYADLPYVKATQPKSILCMPLMHQSQLRGILYLENTLATGAFTKERLQILRTISAQAAISIENAQLYGELEQRVELRTTELRQANDDLQVAHSDLGEKHQQLLDAQGHLVQSEKMASLGTLVSGIAHELNNPLSFTNNGAQNVQTRLKSLFPKLQTLAPESLASAGITDLSEVSETLSRNLKAVTEGTQRMSALIKDLQTFSQHDQAQRKRIQVSEGLKATISLLQTTYDTNTVQVQYEFTDDPRIVCYPAQLNQLFMNIALNACQAIVQKRKGDEAQAPGSLTFTSAIVGDMLELCCVDDGVGISPEHIDHVFEPFFTTKAVGEGIGLGLSVAYNIVQQHEGSLRIDSIPNEGTTVTILLPLKKKKKKGISARPTKLTP